MKTKRLIALFIVLSLIMTTLSTVSIASSDFTVSNGVLQRWTGTDAVVTIPYYVTEIGSNAFDFQTSVTSIIIPNSVTSIDNAAFRNCSNLTSINYGSGVTNINIYQFYGCQKLCQINVDDNNLFYSSQDGVVYDKAKETLVLCPSGKGNCIIPDIVTSVSDYAFYKCSALTDVTIGSGITSIGKFSFGYCTKLTSITIPDNVISIGSDAFNNCTGLISITIGNGITSIDKNTFNTCTGLTNVTLGSNVTTIGDYAFEACNKLTYIKIPDSVIDIGSYTFNSCTNLADVIFGSSMKSIGDYAFNYCSKLSSATLPDSLNSIGISAFYKCTALKSVTTGINTTTIGDYSFKECTGLTSMTIKGNFTNIGTYAFNNCSILANVSFEGGVAINNYAFTGCNKLASISIPSGTIGEAAFAGCIGLTNVQTGNGVTSIGVRAFYRCNWLTSVSLSDSVTTISTEAFLGCSRLTTITNLGNVGVIEENTFKDCGSLTSVTIPDSVVTIGNSAFNNCSNLSSVILGNSVTSIGDDAFYDCYRLKQINIPQSVTTIGTGAFEYCSSLGSVTIPEGVTIISAGAFSNCTSLSNITIPERVTTIGASAFSRSGLTSVEIPDSVTSMGIYAFYNCTKLTTAIIGNSVPSIGNYTFSDCYVLSSVVIPDSVTSIGNYAFSNISSLDSLIIPDKVTYIGDYAFSGTDIHTITIPDSVTYIGACAFLECGALKTITLSKKLTTIGSKTFYNCFSLTSVIIPDSVTSIGDRAFVECFRLTKVKVPNSVTSIGDYAFSYCDKLTIYGDVNSYIKTYADTNNIPFMELTDTKAPSDLNMTDKSDTTVSLSWTAVEGVDGYNVYNGELKVNDVPITTTNFTVVNLTRNTTYTFTVTSINWGEESVHSQSITTDTLSTQTPAPTPTPTPTPIVTPTPTPTQSYIIKVGDYVLMGKYNDEPILWRCVDIDENGPLMLSDRILTIKPFDAAGNHKYLDGTTQADVTSNRNSFGSDLWETSNMRSWLNSTATAGNVTWLDGCPPTADKVYNGWNAYASEKGFLAEDNFTTIEQNAIKNVTQKSLLNGADVTKLKVGGTALHIYNDNVITKAVENFDTAYYQNVTDKMFLLDAKQINKVYQNSGTLGAMYYIGKPTQKAVDKSECKDGGLSTEQYCSNWNRTPLSASNSCHFIRYVSSNGSLDAHFANLCYFGARPAFYINLSSDVFKSGNGSVGTPYVVIGGSDPTPTATPTLAPTLAPTPTLTPIPTPTPSPTEIPIGATILTVGSASGFTDTNVNVLVNISANSGLAAGSFILHYDPAKIEVVTAVRGPVLATLTTSVYSNVTEGSVKISFAGDPGITDTGSVLDVVFKIKSTSTGIIPLTLEVEEMINENFDNITYGIIQGTINSTLLGDATGDGKITSADALKILQSITEKVVLTDIQKVAADVTKNGLIQPSDALKVLQYCSGKISGF